MSSKTSLLDDLNRQTAKIEWQALQPFFAQGQVLFVDATLDLIKTSAAIVEDDKKQIESLMQQNLLHKVTDEQALDWFNCNQQLWAVVVDPWVVVQLVAPIAD